VRELAAREQACCAFFTFAVTEQGDEILWDAGVVDDDAARAVLDGFYELPAVLAGPGAGFDATNTVQPIGGVASERSAP
jgi:hypothetical protein